MKAICIEKTLGIEIGLEYEVSQCPQNDNGFVVEGVTPFYYRQRVVVAINKRAFAQISEIDERDLSHAEPIESTFKLIEV